jgi:hypothetical protein
LRRLATLGVREMDLNAIPIGATDCAREVCPMINLPQRNPPLLLASIHAVLHAEMQAVPQALVIANLFGWKTCLIPRLVVGNRVFTALFHSEL